MFAKLWNAGLTVRAEAFAVAGIFEKENVNSKVQSLQQRPFTLVPRRFQVAVQVTFSICQQSCSLFSRPSVPVRCPAVPPAAPGAPGSTPTRTEQQHRDRRGAGAHNTARELPQLPSWLLHPQLPGLNRKAVITPQVLAFLTSCNKASCLRHAALLPARSSSLGALPLQNPLHLSLGPRIPSRAVYSANGSWGRGRYNLVEPCLQPHFIFSTRFVH